MLQYPSDGNISRCFTYVPFQKQKRRFFENGNMKWQVSPSVTIKDSKPYLEVKIKCLNDYNTSNLWSCRAEIDVKVESICGGMAISKKLCCFHHRLTSLNFKKLMVIGSASDKYVLLTLFRIHINIRINSTVGIEHFQLSNFNIPRNNDSEIVLRIGKQKLFVDKYPLICFSSVFRKKLSDNSNQNLDELEIDYEKVDMFEKFLQLLYGQKVEITIDDVEDILELASKYEVQHLIADCEDFLLSTREIQNCCKLSVAKKFGLAKLQDEISEEIQTK